MTLKLQAQFAADEAARLRDGWRGIVDFGEVWTEADSDLWKDEWGAYAAR